MSPMRNHPWMDDERGKTEEMKIEQAGREEHERDLAARDDSDAGTATHERRADKHAYLKEKLAEREESERKAAEKD